MKNTILAFLGPSREFRVNYCMNILVIEDSSIAAAFLKYKFHALKKIFPNVRVELALSLRAADKILETFDPDIITLDLTLEGVETSDYVKSRLPELAKLATVIIITCADLDIYSAQELLALGADTVLEKDTMTSQAFLNQILSICTRIVPREVNAVPALIQAGPNLYFLHLPDAAGS